MKKQTLKDFVTIFAILVIVGQAFAFYFTTRDRNEDVELLKIRQRAIRLDNYCTYQYVEAIAKKVLTVEEFNDIKLVAEVDREELRKLLENEVE